MANVSNDNGDVGFQIAPMVDVVFVLMLFFMASAGVQIVEKALKIGLPSGRSVCLQTPLKVDITKDGLVFVNDQQFGKGLEDKELTALREFFKNGIAKYDDQDPVIICPAPDTQHERIMDVLNAACNAGVKKLTFN